MVTNIVNLKKKKQDYATVHTLLGSEVLRKFLWTFYYYVNDTSVYYHCALR